MGGDEVGDINRNHTWDETDLPLGKRLVSSKWIFTTKAHLGARGFTLTYGDDYMDTFSHVAKLHMVRVVLPLLLIVLGSYDRWMSRTRFFLRKKST